MRNELLAMSHATSPSVIASEAKQSVAILPLATEAGKTSSKE
jgi:hypothetical protein